MRVDENARYQEIVFPSGDTLKGHFRLTRTVGDLDYSSQVVVVGQVEDNPSDQSWYLRGAGQILVPLSSVMLLKVAEPQV